MRQNIKYYQIKNNKTVEVKRKYLKHYLNKQSIFVYDNNLHPKGVLLF